MRVVLTGGAGLIGSHIADLLAADGEVSEIVVFDDFSRGTETNLAGALASGKVDIVRGDVRDRGHVREVVAGADAVFHLAAIRITRCAAEPRLAHEVLSTGTFNVFEAAAETGVGKVIFSSSASVYGLADHFPTTERQHPYNNTTIYGAAKAYGEGLLRSFKATHDLDGVALRYFNVYGPRMDTEGVYTEVFVRWMQAVAAGEPPVIHGDGSATIDLAFVEDIARANLAAWRSDVTDGVFNIAYGREVSLLELAHGIIRTMGGDVRPVHTAPRVVNGVTRRWADVSAARERLGFRAQVDLDEGLERLVAWWRSTTAVTDKASV